MKSLPQIVKVFLRIRNHIILELTSFTNIIMKTAFVFNDLCCMHCYSN